MSDTTQDTMLNFDKNKILGLSLSAFLPPAESGSALAAIKSVFDTGIPLYHSYSFCDYAFLWLVDKLNNDIVAVHEVFDDPNCRYKLKKFLWVASGQYYKQFKGDKTK